MTSFTSADLAFLQRSVDTFDVAAWGARGDGVTDDTAAIQAAINAAAAAGGGTVKLSPGTYIVSAPLSVEANSIHIAGAGPGATVLSPTSLTADVITAGLTGTRTDLSVRGLTIGGAAPRTAGAAVHWGTVFRGHVEDCDLIAPFNGVYLSGPSSIIYLRGIYIVNVTPATGVGVYMNGFANDVYLSDVLMDNPPASQPFAGIRLSSASGIWLTDCDILHAGHGLRVDPPASQTVQWLFALNCAFDSCAIAGVYINASTATSTITGLQFTACWTSSNGMTGTTAAVSGIHGLVVLGAAGSTINGLSFVGHRAFVNTGDGMLINAGNDILVEAAQASGNSAPPTAAAAYQGIAIGGTVNGCQVIGCRSGQMAGFANTQNYGIAVIGATPTNYLIATNDVRSNVAPNPLLDQGTTTQKNIRDNLGFNPIGYLGALAVPASGTTFDNPSGADATVYLAGGTISAVVVGGSTTGVVATPATVHVPAGSNITLTYTVAPTWTWFAD